jgi:hypothetical protein
MDYKKNDEAVASFLNLSRKRFPPPPLPSSMEKCAKLAKTHFAVVEQDKMETISGGGYGRGGESATKMVLRCPFCGFEFDAIERASCLDTSLAPHYCPNCDFPRLLILKALEITCDQKRGENKT